MEKLESINIKRIKSHPAILRVKSHTRFEEYENLDIVKNIQLRASFNKENFDRCTSEISQTFKFLNEINDIM
jgi:hypothetical protein